MCNMYNTSSRSGCCGYNSYSGCTGGSLWNLSQSICRDCCGNIRVKRNCGCNCCCGCGCGCNCGCGNTDNNGGAATGNGNGNYGCVTICGAATSNVNTTSTVSNGDYYYARQYGLGRSTCSYCNNTCNV